MDSLLRIPLRLPLLLSLVALGFLVAGADGCGSDPNVAGARLELKNQDYDRVLQLTETALEANPDNAEAHFLRGEAFRLKAEGENDAATRGALLADMTQAYTRAGELGHSADEVTHRLPVARGTEMNFGARAFRRAAEDPNAYEDAVASFRNATVVVPDSAAGFLNQGLALLALGQTSDARDPLQTALDLGSQSPEAFIYLGRIYLQEDRADDALTTLERGQEMFPDNEELQIEILNAYVRAGQVDRAISAYDARIAASPNDPLYRYNYGSLLLQAERYDEAIEQLARAVELDPQNANAFYNLGAAYQNQAASFNEQIEALEDRGASQAEVDAAIDRRNDLLRQALPHLERARSLTEAGGDDAADICRALLQVYASIGDLQKAEEAAACAGEDIN